VFGLEKMKIRGLVPIRSKKDRAVKMAVFDIETFGIGGDPYAVGFYDGKIYDSYEGKQCIERFIAAFLKTKYRGYVCYAHNGGKYDFTYFLEHFFNMGYHRYFEIHVIRQASRIVQMIFYRGRHSWTLRDSMGLFNFSLSKITESFNVKHKKGEIEHDKINEKNYMDYAEKWRPYLKSDCLGLYEVLQKFEHFLLSKYGVSLKKVITLSSGAMRVYRKKFMPVEFIPSYITREPEIRQSYFGGRTEIFKFTGENLNYYDVNSLYPYVMDKYPMPVGVPIKSFMMDIDDFGIAYADIKAPKDLDIPVLPYRLDTQYYKKLIFPVGNFSGWYNTPELQKAHEKGYEINIKYGYKFEKYHIFREYVTEFYKMKNQAEPDTVEYQSSKLLMNMLYGKFGQRREREEIIFFPKDIAGLEPLDIHGELDIYKKDVISKSNQVLPAIASFVTTYARLELFKLLDGNNPYYCDTDSIVTQEKLKTGKQLGELKLEAKIKKAIFLRPKMYAIEIDPSNRKLNKNKCSICGKEFNNLDVFEKHICNSIKAKGFPKSVRKNFDFDMFNKALKTGDYSKLSYKSDSEFATLFTSLRRNKRIRSMIDRKRGIRTEYDKRISMPDGINTKPICL